MGITRASLSIDEHFTAVPNEWARDARLSRRARGLLVEVMSHRVGWHITIRSLAASGKEGRDAIQSALAELLAHGYVRRSQGRASAGKFAEIEYELCDPPTVSGFPAHGSAASGSAVSGESATKKNISSEDHLEEDQPSSSEVAAAPLRPDVAAILDLLDEEIQKNGGKVPSRTKKNIDAARLMLDRDGRSLEQVLAAIRWCQADEFWRANILSTSKLRAKYETLRLQASRRGNLSVIDRGRQAHQIIQEREAEQQAARRRALEALR